MPFHYEMGQKNSVHVKDDGLAPVVSAFSALVTAKVFSAGALNDVFQNLDTTVPDWTLRFSADARRWDVYEQMWNRGWHAGLITLRNKIAPTSDVLYLGIIPRPWQTSFK